METIPTTAFPHPTIPPPHSSIPTPAHHRFVTRDGPVRGLRPEHLLHEGGVGKGIQHVVYPAQALVREVIADQLLQEVPAVVADLGEEHFVERESHLVETDHRFHDRVELVAQLK
ncbi:hypothetical protein E2C01_005512 [Portunus trituberculatus]|uniref:Uncharacterized protein n=1 Tax=Portunus trituberculatus TaxID=210409 RepID=A0A5B7CSX9_PORTR|nr:hypothetical protein [Portunus trituberculatus]